MEFFKMDEAVIEKTVRPEDWQTRELDDLHLALVGGGNGAVIIA